MVDECRPGLSAVLPLTAKETAFLDKILDRGKICPELLTDDDKMASRIVAHPLLLWKAENVRKHKGQAR
ncbi:MAG: hypothetical protein KGY99_09955 [Phycisphaerae bacterium]|nr:hypothetical protein [Phycisphaerae bacterium]